MIAQRARLSRGTGRKALVLAACRAASYRRRPMNITGSTRVFLILGDPVAQVRAPEVFNHLFARHGVDAVLVPAQVAPRDLAAFVRHAFAARNIDGLLAHDSAQGGDAAPAGPLRPRSADRAGRERRAAQRRRHARRRTVRRRRLRQGAGPLRHRGRAARACWWSAPAAAAWRSPSRWPNAAWPALALLRPSTPGAAPPWPQRLRAGWPACTSSSRAAPTRPATTS